MLVDLVHPSGVFYVGEKGMCVFGVKLSLEFGNKIFYPLVDSDKFSVLLLFQTFKSCSDLSNDTLLYIL
jgi:hypothetical protein